MKKIAISVISVLVFAIASISPQAEICSHSICTGILSLDNHTECFHTRPTRHHIENIPGHASIQKNAVYADHFSQDKLFHKSGCDTCFLSSKMRNLLQYEPRNFIKKINFIIKTAYAADNFNSLNQQVLIMKTGWHQTGKNIYLSLHKFIC